MLFSSEIHQYFTPTRLIYGAGSLTRLGQEARSLGEAAASCSSVTKASAGPVCCREAWSHYASRAYTWKHSPMSARTLMWRV